MSSTISLFVSSPDTHSERRFDLHTTISQLKVRPPLALANYLPDSLTFHPLHRLPIHAPATMNLMTLL